jgi:SAM-dependent methyltransferase
VPEIEENVRLWKNEREWIERGEQWSRTWGGVEAQWFFTIHPRIHTFLPAGTILEIAPGFGRWTQFLKSCSQKLILVDLVSDCIEACKTRFEGEDHIDYHVNDGRSLEMIPDESIDFVFSFDSLVHAESDIIQEYLQQLGRKLKPDGVGFIHHSNLGEYRRAFALFNRIQRPSRFRTFLKRRGIIDADHWRAPSMTAQLFEQHCGTSGLECISQELVNWQGVRLIDTFSLFTRKGSALAKPNRRLRNPGFMDEARRAAQFAELYCGFARVG